MSCFIWGYSYANVTYSQYFLIIQDRKQCYGLKNSCVLLGMKLLFRKSFNSNKNILILPESRPDLAVVSAQIKVDSLRRASVPPAVTRCKRHPNNSSSVPRGEPALFVVAPPAHRLVLFTLGYPALPREAEDVGVAAEDGTVFHGGQHSYWVTRLVGKAEEQYWTVWFL